MLPLMASIGFMAGVAHGELSLASLLAAVTFAVLGGGMFVGAFRMARGWEDEAEPATRRPS
jgi:hypothetical protein